LPAGTTTTCPTQAFSQISRIQQYLIEVCRKLLRLKQALGSRWDNITFSKNSC
jgi:hypothetical protein